VLADYIRAALRMEPSANDPCLGSGSGNVVYHSWIQELFGETLSEFSVQQVSETLAKVCCKACVCP